MSDQIPWIANTDEAVFQRYLTAIELFRGIDLNSDDEWLTRATIRAVRELSLEWRMVEQWRKMEVKLYELVMSPLSGVSFQIRTDDALCSRSAAARFLRDWKELPSGKWAEAKPTVNPPAADSEPNAA